MSGKDIKKALEETLARIKEDKNFVKSLYGDNYHRLGQLESYLIGSRSLMDFISDKANLDLLMNDTDILGKSSKETKKAEYHYEKNTVGCFLLSSPKTEMFTHRVDVVKSKKIIPRDFKDELSSLDFDAKHLVDIEFFDFIPPDKLLLNSKHVKYFCDNLSLSNKETYKAIKDEGIFWDKEKIHLIYAVGDFKGEKRYLPAYIGIGSNEPYGLKIKGERGKQRFYRFDLLSKVPFKEQGIVFDDKVPEKDFFARAKEGNLTYIEDTWNNKDVMVFMLSDCSSDYDPHYDADRFKGFARYKCDVDSKYPLDPRPKIYLGEVKTDFDISLLDRKQVVSNMLNQNWNNSSDFLLLLEEKLNGYDEFFSLHNSPEKMVKELGVDSIYNHLVDHNALDSFYINADNLASDLATVMSQGCFRLRASSLVAGCYSLSGKLDEMILE